MSRTQQFLSTNGLDSAGSVQVRTETIAISAAIWAALLAWFLGTVFVAAGTVPVSLATGEILACLFGLAICLVCARPLARRLAEISPWTIGALPILGAAAAIVWTIFARLIAFPLARSFAHGSAISAPHQPTGAIAILFVCWAALILMLRERSFPRTDPRDADHRLSSELWVPTPRGRIALPLDNISKVTAEREYARVHTVSGSSHLVRSSIARLRGQLGQTFVQVHRSTLVNARHITGYRRSEGSALVLSLADGSEARVGKNFRSPAKELLQQRDSFGSPRR